MACDTKIIETTNINIPRKSRALLVLDEIIKINVQVNDAYNGA